MRTPLERVRAAQAEVGHALELCKGSSLSDLARACEFLHKAAGELHSIQSDFGSTGIADRDGQFREQLTSLKRDMAAAGRVVDAGSAWHRGLALRISGTATAYTPTGSRQAEAPAVTTVEIEG